MAARISLRDRLKAALHDRLSARFEHAHGAELRRRQLTPASGRVLEIGGGTGANLPHYPPTVDELLVSEPNDGMRRRAERRAHDERTAATIVKAAAEDLPFADGSLDTVVGTFVLCSVDDQTRALAEIRRVLKPGGQLLFAEHVRAGDPKLATWQDRLERPWRILVDGCHPNRDTLAAIERAGFQVEDVERGELPMVPRLVRPYVAGRARKPA